MTSVWHTWCYC